MLRVTGFKHVLLPHMSGVDGHQAMYDYTPLGKVQVQMPIDSS